MEDEPGDVSEPVGRGNRQEGLERRTGNALNICYIADRSDP